jgi:predicted dehydrogenase
MTTTPLQWGILSAGHIARKFAVDLQSSRSNRLVAVASRHEADAAAFASAFGGVRAHGSYAALLADPEVQAVYIGTLHPWHAEWAIEAARAGKHVLCEKPLALNLADAQRMIEAARDHGVLLMEAFMYRFHPQTLKIAELVRTGQVGEVRVIRASFNFAADFDPGHRLFNKGLGGGAILDVGCYPMSFARLIAGQASGRTFANPTVLHGVGRIHPVAQTDEFASAVARFPGGVLAELSCGTTILDDQSAQIYGTDGWIDVPTPFLPGQGGRDEVIWLHKRGNAVPEKIAIDHLAHGLYTYEADAVAEAVARGATEVPAMTWADTLGNIAALDTWRQAVGMRYEGE